MFKNVIGLPTLIIVGLIGLASTSVKAVPTLNINLLTNPGAELDPYSTSDTLVSPPTGWEILNYPEATGHNVEAWTAVVGQGGDIAPHSGSRVFTASRGDNYTSLDDWLIGQVVDVSGAGGGMITASAWGVGQGNDTVTLIIRESPDGFVWTDLYGSLSSPTWTNPGTKTWMQLSSGILTLAEDTYYLQFIMGAMKPTGNVNKGGLDDADLQVTFIPEQPIVPEIVTVIPVPGAALLAATGTAVVSWLRRRRTL